MRILGSSSIFTIMNLMEYPKEVFYIVLDMKLVVFMVRTLIKVYQKNHFWNSNNVSFILHPNTITFQAYNSLVGVHFM